MSNYVKTTNFTSKDSLASGNPLKIVKGAEFDVEFNAIATAVASKADSDGATLTTTTITSPTITSPTITGGSMSSLATDIAVADGGTGASTAADARTNLSAAKSGANSDITSLTGLTTPLSVAQGGTGANSLTANNVLLGNGTSAPSTVAPSTSGNLLTSNGTTWQSTALVAFPSFNTADTLSYNTSYSASSNGFVTVAAIGSYKNGLTVQVGPDGVNWNIIAYMGDDMNNNTKASSFMFPIKKGSYFKIAPWTGYDAFEDLFIYFWPAV